MKFELKTNGWRDDGDPDEYPLNDGDLVTGYNAGYYRYKKTFLWRKEGVYAGQYAPVCPGEGWCNLGESAEVTLAFTETGKPVKNVKTQIISKSYCIPAKVHVARKIKFLRETEEALKNMLV